MVAGAILGMLVGIVIVMVGVLIIEAVRLLAEVDTLTPFGLFAILTITFSTVIGAIFSM